MWLIYPSSFKLSKNGISALKPVRWELFSEEWGNISSQTEVLLTLCYYSHWACYSHPPHLLLSDETADLWIFPPGVFWWNSITNDCESRLVVIPNLAQCFRRNVLARCSRSVALSWLLECSPLSHNESHPWENLCFVHAHIFVVFCIASARACVCVFYKPSNLNWLLKLSAHQQSECSSCICCDCVSVFDQQRCLLIAAGFLPWGPDKGGGAGRGLVSIRHFICLGGRIGSSMAVPRSHS